MVTVETDERRRKLATCGCGAQWGGMKTCHCGRCHRTFTGLTAFDHHRPGTCSVDRLVVVRNSGNQQVWGVPDTSGRWGNNRVPGGPPTTPAPLTESIQQLLAKVQARQAEL